MAGVHAPFARMSGTVGRVTSRRRVTIKDVAAATGLSPAAVSYALRASRPPPRPRSASARPPRSSATRATPSPARCPSGRTGLVGVISGSLQDLGEQRFVESLGRGLGGRDLQMLVADADGEPERERALARQLADHLVDGLIVSPLTRPTSPGPTSGRCSRWSRSATRWPARRSARCCSTTAPACRSCSSTCTSSATAASPCSRRAARRRPTGRRERVVVEVCAALGLDATVVNSRHSIEAATEAADALLDIEPRPTAVFCLSDSIACGVYAAAAARGPVIPGDLSVAGYDNHPIASVVRAGADQRRLGDARGRRPSASALLAAAVAGQAAQGLPREGARDADARPPRLDGAALLRHDRGARRMAGAAGTARMWGSIRPGRAPPPARARTWAASASRLGRYQLRCRAASSWPGSSTARTIVASIRIAAARPTPSCFISWSEPVAKAPNVTTMTAAALVMTPAVLLMPWATALLRGHAAVDQLADPAQDEHVVVHREAEQDHEQEQRQPGRDAADRREPERLLTVAVLEDQRQHAVGRADRQQVQDDRLDRHHDRAERDQQQDERQAEHEPRTRSAGATSSCRGSPSTGRSCRSPRPRRRRACRRWPGTTSSRRTSHRVVRGGVGALALDRRASTTATVLAGLISTLEGSDSSPVAIALSCSCLIADCTSGRRDVLGLDDDVGRQRCRPGTRRRCGRASG